MARARNIKPSFFVNEELVELQFSTRLLFIGLWTIADRAGRLEDKPKKIKMALFPADDLDIDAALNDLQSSGLIKRYIVNEIKYIQILTFEKHQNPHVKEPASIIPAPDEHHASTVQATLIPDSLNPITDSPSLIADCSPCAADESAAANKKGSQLPKDWVLPKSWGQWALSEKPEFTADMIRKEADKFKDHWLANANQRTGKKSDWEAAWRNWVRGAKPDGGFKTKTQIITEKNKLAGDDFINEANEKTIEGEVLND